MLGILRKLFLISPFFLFVTCDRIDDPYADIKKITPGDTTTPDTSVVVRKILIEDFTGHECGNCPQAAITSQELMETYGDQVIIVAVHAGFFAEPESGSPGDPYTTDFRTTAGEAYNTEFGNDLAGNPNGFVSRSKVINNDIIVKPSNWASAVEELKNNEPMAKLTAKVTEYNTSSRQLNLEVSAKFLTDLSGNYNLVVYLVEDSITDWQKDYSLPTGQQDVQNYLHRHVLRDNINGTWGEQIASGTVVSGTKVDKSFSYTINASWNHHRCSVIAYVYDDATYEIIQVEEKHVID